MSKIQFYLHHTPLPQIGLMLLQNQMWFWLPPPHRLQFKIQAQAGGLFRSEMTMHLQEAIAKNPLYPMSNICENPLEE